MPGYITLREAAHITGYTIDELSGLIDDGALPNTHFGMGHVQIRIADLYRLG